MNQSILFPAVKQLAQSTHHFSDMDLSQPYAWRVHEEGVRFALLGTYHELRDLAAALAQARRSLPVTAVQHILAQHHTGYRELQAVLLGVTDEIYDQKPAPGEWPLRDIIGHIVDTERYFFTLIHRGLTDYRAGQTPPPFSDDDIETIIGPRADFVGIWENQGMAEMLAHYDALHQRSLQEFGNMNEEELAAPTPLWWEGEAIPLQYRLHRFDAHLRQHLIQAEKTLAMIGHLPNEARRLLRLVYQALAEVEGITIGAPDLEPEPQKKVATAIQARAEAVTAVVTQCRALETAVKDGDLATIKTTLQTHPKLANALDQAGLSLVLTATYHRRQDIADAFIEAGARLSIFVAAATGNLVRAQELGQEWPGWLNLYGRDGFTPLQLACFFGREDVALWLIEHNADVNAVAQNNQKIAPIHAATANGNQAIITALLEHSADVNLSQQGGITPLQQAAHKNDMTLVKLFLQYGADVHHKDDKGQTAFDQAMADNHQEIAGLLRQEMA